MLSDHKCLLTKILTKGIKLAPQTVPNYSKVNWQGFHNDLVNRTEVLVNSEINSEDDLDRVTSTLTGLIQTALTANAPKLKIPLTQKSLFGGMRRFWGLVGLSEQPITFGKNISLLYYMKHT